jgi:hypothetical protein
MLTFVGGFLLGVCMSAAIIVVVTGIIDSVK